MGRILSRHGIDIQSVRAVSTPRSKLVEINSTKSLSTASPLCALLVFVLGSLEVGLEG